jgi:hypothetical protein
VTAFHGSYRNAIRVTASFGGDKDSLGWCNSPGQPIIHVLNGQLTYEVPHPNAKLIPTPVFRATMAENGSFFYGMELDRYLFGRITGLQIEGRIDGAGCVYAFRGNRI